MILYVVLCCLRCIWSAGRTNDTWLGCPGPIMNILSETEKHNKNKNNGRIEMIILISDEIEWKD